MRRGADVRPGSRRPAASRWEVGLPFGLLAVATAVALVAQPAMPRRPGGTVLVVALVVATAGWLVVAARLPREAGPVRGATFWVRTFLAFCLTLLNPFFAIFSFVGMTDAFDTFRRRGAAHAGLLATAVITGGAQSGGLPPASGWQAATFVGLVAVNFGLGSVFATMHLGVVEARDEHAATAADLTRLNTDLTRAVEENAALQRRLVAQARETGVQQERQRLAREIHDTLAQDLAGIVAQLEAVRGDGDPVRVARALDLARGALTEARRSVLDLAPVPLGSAGLTSAVRAAAASWSAGEGVDVEVHESGDPVELHPEVEAAVLRIVQESLVNVRKHAAATRVDVTLSHLEDEILVDVRDDGVGFDVAASRRPTSFGLRGMRQRAERLAGEMVVESAPGRGTVVSLRLPALAPGVLA